MGIVAATTSLAAGANMTHTCSSETGTCALVAAVTKAHNTREYTLKQPQDRTCSSVTGTCTLAAAPFTVGVLGGEASVGWGGWAAACSHAAGAGAAPGASVPPAVRLVEALPASVSRTCTARCGMMRCCLHVCHGHAQPGVA